MLPNFTVENKRHVDYIRLTILLISIVQFLSEMVKKNEDILSLRGVFNAEEATVLYATTSTVCPLKSRKFLYQYDLGGREEEKRREIQKKCYRVGILGGRARRADTKGKGITL